MLHRNAASVGHLQYKSQVSPELYSKFERYTAFSAAAYADSCATLPYGSTVVQYFNDSATDSQATLFKDADAHEIIIAFRGTSSQRSVSRPRTGIRPAVSGRVQLFFKKLFGFTVPFFPSKGPYKFDFGVMPHRKPVNIVVGRPIPTRKLQDPVDERYLDEVHGKYIAELDRIWGEWKDVFGGTRMEMTIL
ncbi:hypothetical protein BDW62DRAFT_203451 [Aspergillus aurantiobrunneus]